MAAPPSDIFDSHKEPDEVFLPLTPERYSHFYALEMADFQDDLPFYRERINGGEQVLELGCGNCRLCRLLAATGATLTGIDLSRPMLRQARQHPHPATAAISYMCMDMTALAFRQSFDTVIIPYHTLNLLVSEEQIVKALTEVKSVLKYGGKLLLQLFVPDQTTLDLGRKKLFQFQIFEQADTSMIIKEVRRGYARGQLTLEERYRIRPSQQSGQTREGLTHTLRLAAFSLQKWQTLFAEAEPDDPATLALRPHPLYPRQGHPPVCWATHAEYDQANVESIPFDNRLWLCYDIS